MDRIIRVRSTKLDKEEESLKAIGRQKEAELRENGILLSRETLFKELIIAPLAEKGKLGYFDSRQKTIVISEELVSSASWDDTVNVLIHEMGHALDYLQHGNLEHSESFRKCCALLGIAPGFEKSKVRISLKQNDKEKDRVRKLLALSSSPFENEAAEAIKKAKELMAGKDIKIDDEDDEKIYMVSLFEAERFPSYVKALINYISESTGIYPVLEHRDATMKAAVIYGTLEEVEASIYLWDYLVSSSEMEIAKLRCKGMSITKDSFIRGAIAALKSKTEDSASDHAIMLLRNENKERALKIVFKDIKLRARKYYSRGGDARSFSMGQGFGSKLSVPERIGRKRIE